MVQFNAHFDGNAIQPDENVQIPVNVPLRVTIEPAPAELGPPTTAGTTGVETDPPLPTLAERLKDFIGCLDGLPADAATNHDHYLYGARKNS